MNAFLRSVAGAVLGMGMGLALCQFSGESPWTVLQVLYGSSFGSGYDFGMTLFYAAPLILTGLAVAIPFRAGLFNIGAEGQLTMGALFTAAAGIYGAHIESSFLAVLLGGVAGFVGGALWAAIPGVLKAKRGSHEVITTIMLNFVAAGMAAYATLYVLKDPETAQAETQAVGEAFRLQSFASFEGAPMGKLIFFLMLLVLVLHFWLKKSVTGYELKAVGESERAAETYGISKSTNWIKAMVLGGGAAGLVGLIEVLGNSHRFKIGFSADYGFVGIAVALVARGNLLAILPSAFLFGVLQKGAGSLDLETEYVTRDLSYILQGLIILGVASDGLWDWVKTRRKEKR